LLLERLGKEEPRRRTCSEIASHPGSVDPMTETDILPRAGVKAE
jgi:hypothetical protein